MNLYQLPPVGEKLPLFGFFHRPALDFNRQFKDYRGYHCDSGTSALAAALLLIKQQNPSRSEVVIPAYCCPDVVSAIRFAGLTPVLVDLEKNSTFIDLTKLDEMLTAKSLAVVAINFAGIKERIAQLKEIAECHGAVLVEDSAQFSPWRSKVELIADYVTLSFGRGKPESVLTGGALLVRNNSVSSKFTYSEVCTQKGSVTNSLKYFFKAVAYNIALSPRVFAGISSIKFLHVGETFYKKHLEICEMPELARKVLAVQVNRCANSTEAVRIYNDFFSGVEDILSLPLSCNSEQEALLRYPVLLPDSKLKERLIQKLSYLGVSEMYPDVLYKIRGLSWLMPTNNMNNAIAFAERMITLPCHSRVSSKIANQIIEGISNELVNF